MEGSVMKDRFCCRQSFQATVDYYKVNIRTADPPRNARRNRQPPRSTRAL
jgi:hypothetical protein